MVNQLLAQMLNLLRSSFKTLSNSAKLVEEKLREVSSAKSLAIPSFISQLVSNIYNNTPSVVGSIFS